MAAVGSVIYGSDYNSVVTKVVGVLGTGSGYASNFGWNQTLSSNNVSPGAKITAAQWNNLVSDVNTAYLHVYGVSNQVPTVSGGGKVTYAQLSTLNNTVNTLLTVPNTVYSSQLATATVFTNTYGSTWGSGATGISTTGSFTFASSAQMQYFFNQGGKVTLSGVGPTSNGVTQTTDWINMLAGFTYTWNIGNFNTYSSSTLVVNLANEPSPYSANYAKLWTYTSGTTIYFTVEYYDSHVGTGGGPDSVNSGAGFTVQQYYATGAFSGYTVYSSSGANSWSTTTS